MQAVVARGPGPIWARWLFVALAALYFIGLFVYSPGWKSVPQRSAVKPIAFFLEAAGLFPNADLIAFEYRLEGWSCSRRRWERMDPRPYFPIEADNKESRFQRAMWFFRHSPNEHTVLAALDDYVTGRHADTADGLDGPIGGIRIYEVWRALPPPGGDTARYDFHPLDPLHDGEHRKDWKDDKHEQPFYKTHRDERAKRCKAGT